MRNASVPRAMMVFSRAPTPFSRNHVMREMDNRKVHMKRQGRLQRKENVTKEKGGVSFMQSHTDRDNAHCLVQD